MEGGGEMGKALRIFLSLISGAVSYFVFGFLYRVYLYQQTIFHLTLRDMGSLIFSLVCSAVVGIIFYLFISPRLTKRVLRSIHTMESELSQMTLKELFISISGILVGLVMANLLGIAVWRYGFLGTLIMLPLNMCLGYLGYAVAQRKKEELHILEACAAQEISSGRPKILDTSVIIDGRILDILKTGFIEGKIVIPNFVLEELRHIADSSDSLKRNRGRRGLDILNEIQKQLQVAVEIVELDFKEVSEVDSKLLKMAQQMDAMVVTNDFNLNKVADFQGVFVLNINELANAIKPVVLPGEDMIVAVMKDGKENGQGIGYLNDGTMIVVEGGKKYMGETIEVLVTSVLQTAAGRMIFTKAKLEES